MFKRINLSLSGIAAILIYILTSLHQSFATWMIHLWILVVSFIGVFFVLNLLYFLTLYILSLFIDMKKEYETRSKFAEFMFNRTLEYLLFLSRTHVKTSGLEKVPHDVRYMLVTNHKSNWDPMIECWYLRKDHPNHISKPSNLNIPIAGPFMHRCRFLIINRDNNREGALTIIKAINYIKNGEYSIGVAPEGTRNKGEGLLPFRDGCFKIALKAKCPIVVCTVKNTEMIHKNFPFKPTHVDLHIVEVIPYEEIAGLPTHEIAKRVRLDMIHDLGYPEEPEEEIENKEQGEE